MKLGLFGIVVMTMMSSGAALAAPPGERMGDRQEVREDRRETRDDLWDAARLQALLNDYRAARRARDGGALSALDNRFMAEIVVEVHESRVETGEKADEVRDARGERNGERREVVKDVVTDHPGHAANDRRDLRDDRRDLRDDRHDLAKEAAALKRKKAIRDAYQQQLGRVDGRSLGIKEGLIKKAVAEAKLEVRQDVKEKHEDVRELREDRRDVRHPD